MTTALGPDSRAVTRPSAEVPSSSGRRRPAWVIGGVVLVFLCALGSAFWWSQASGRVAVLVVAVDVPAGQVIEAGDLRTVQVAADSSVDLMPAAERGSVVGRVAAVRLSAGSLLSTAMVGAPLPPEAGQGVVAVSVDAGRYPPTLTSGSTVTVVGGTETSAVPQRWPGVVVDIAPAADGRGGAVVTLRMAASDATDLAASGPVALVERHPGEQD